MLLRRKCTSIIMCIRLIFRRRVSSYLKSDSKFYRNGQIKETRPKRSPNLTGDILKELQAIIALACFDTPSLIRRGTFLAEAVIENKMSPIYYGDDTTEVPDPDLILFEDQLILGLNKFKGLYTRSVLEGPNAEPGAVQLSIPEVLHRHKNLQLYVGEGSIE